MSEVFTTTLISVGATVLTNLIIHGFAYQQKKIENKNKLEEKKVDFLNTQLSQDRDLYISTFQNFASISGKTVSYVESRLDDAPPIDLDIITNFDDIFYKTYLFLDSDEEQKNSSILEMCYVIKLDIPTPMGFIFGMCNLKNSPMTQTQSKNPDIFLIGLMNVY